MTANCRSITERDVTAGNSLVNYIDEMLLPVNGSMLDYLDDTALYPQMKIVGSDGDMESFTWMSKGIIEVVSIREKLFLRP